MSIQAIRSELGAYAKDTKLNLGNVLSADGAPDLNERQIFGIALASAYACRSSVLVEAVKAEAQSILSAAEHEAARSAATIMAMNNVYYRFVHLVGDKEYAAMPAQLRMQVIGAPGIEKADFELYSLAVSAINGCGMCIEAHAHELAKAGVGKKGVQSAVRIAAVIHSAAQALFIGVHETADAVQAA